MWLIKKVGLKNPGIKKTISDILGEISQTAAQSFDDWLLYDGQGRSERGIAIGKLSRSKYAELQSAPIEIKGIIHKCSGGRVYACFLLDDEKIVVGVKLFLGDSKKNITDGWENPKEMFDETLFGLDPIETFFGKNAIQFLPEENENFLFELTQN